MCIYMKSSFSQPDSWVKFEVGMKEQEEYPVVFIAVSSRLVGLHVQRIWQEVPEVQEEVLRTWVLKYWAVDLEDDWSNGEGGE